MRMLLVLYLLNFLDNDLFHKWLHGIQNIKADYHKIKSYFSMFGEYLALESVAPEFSKTLFNHKYISLIINIG